jgi:benzoyl-CoA 2,3-dioxygenase component B
MSEVDYTSLIPNNVDLASDVRLKRALEAWYPKYLDWWRSMGPVDSADYEVYLRTAVGVDSEGWAKFGYVKMPEYRWGILLAPQEEGRKIAFGQHKGEPVWQDLPGEYRAMLRRLVVIQGDTEPASVEQQRFLGKTAPSLYDMRNLFQVNVEEGRHLWAMVYLLQKYFGRDGREEAEDLLIRTSGDADKPRILGAFNEKTPDWLSFYMFTTFTDRDGKMQLESLANSGWDPLARTTVIQRTCEIMNEHGVTDPNDKEAVRKHGGIDLATIQKKINFHYSVTLDLFGAEISTNAANSFNASLKGRYREPLIDDDHQLENDTYPVAQVVDGKVQILDTPALSAINARLCDDFIDDCEKVMLRWNRVFQTHNLDYSLKLPHRAFHRAVGEFADVHATADGELVSETEWQDRKDEWVASDSDLEYILSLMQQETRPGKFADWIAAPRAGINGQPGDFEYVRVAA